mmetsp:Transcript_17289/g.25924  ORF Transcript_17289/g.25924 Transcript_17289/m.25924 type:complete len:328 (+) Transcript_17289:1144-2127(+)
MWSLGAILYSMAYSDLAYDGESAIDVHKKIMSQPLSLVDMKIDRPHKLKAIIEELMRIRPDKRLKLDKVIEKTYSMTTEFSNFETKHVSPKARIAQLPPRAPILVRKKIVSSSGLRPIDSVESIQKLDAAGEGKRETAIIPTIRRPIKSPSISEQMWQLVQLDQMTQNIHISAISGPIHFVLHLSVLLLHCYIALLFDKYALAMLVPQVTFCTLLIWLSNFPNQHLFPWATLRLCLPFVGIVMSLIPVFIPGALISSEKIIYSACIGIFHFTFNAVALFMSETLLSYPRQNLRSNAQTRVDLKNVRPLMEYGSSISSNLLADPSSPR